MDKKIENGIVLGLRNTARKESQTCYSPGCKNTAIKSHIQQEKGPLMEIADANLEVAQIDLHYSAQTDSVNYFFKKQKIGGGKVLTFWGFCNDCDPKIFKEIETKNVDYSNYRNQLLYSYRGLVNEIYKLDYNWKWHELVRKSPHVSLQKRADHSQRQISAQTSADHLKFIKHQLEEELKRDKSSGILRFQYFKVPRIEFCSAAFGGILYETYGLRKSASFFVNLMADETDLHVIIGEYNDVNSNQVRLPNLQGLDNSSKLKVVSDLMIVFMETWCISTALYANWKASKFDDEILDLIKYYRPHLNKVSFLEGKYTVPICIFEPALK